MHRRCFSVKLGDSAHLLPPFFVVFHRAQFLDHFSFLSFKSIIRKHGISYHFYVDDSQICLPLKRGENSLVPLLECLKDIKAWMASNFLNCNEDKTDVIVFGPSFASDILDLGYLQQYTV